jgi:probable F420-dependent oxidoreductase
VPHDPGSAPLGVTFASFQAYGPAAALEVARTAEQLGYRSFWTAETTGPEAFATLAAAGAAAPSLGLGTGVLAIQLRSAPLAAMSAATLQALHPDNDVLLGVGISSPVVTQRWHGVPYGDRPLARMREYVEVVQACLSGESVSTDGEFHQLSRFKLGIRLGERRPKVVLGALNPGMLRLAGEVADGVLLNYLPASHVASCAAHVREGEAKAGRPEGSCRVYGYVHVGVAEREDGIDLARRDLFSYVVVDAYAQAFRDAGFGDEVDEVRARHAAQDREGGLPAVTDPLVVAIDQMGDAAHVQTSVQAYVDAGIEVPVVMPLPWGPDRMAVVHRTIEAAIGA